VGTQRHTYDAKGSFSFSAFQVLELIEHISMVIVPVITQSIFKMDKSPLFLVNWSWFWLDFPTSGLNSCKISQPIYPLTTVT
jgi:hypothetical protein